jgi:hypothetical protein
MPRCHAQAGLRQMEGLSAFTEIRITGGARFPERPNRSLTMAYTRAACRR